MFIRFNSAAVSGLDCVSVDVEVDINRGQTNFTIVGLPDASIREAKDRIYSAIKNSGYAYPFNFRILVNLAPADVSKEGAGYDLPMAVGIIAASNNLAIDTRHSFLVGELALDGSLRHTSGILPLALYARERGWRHVFVPAADAAEAALVSDIIVYPVRHLAEFMAHLTGGSLIAPHVRRVEQSADSEPRYDFDFSEIVGQEFAKRALEIAASGGHNLFLSGPPGAGKTMLARAFPSILPPLIPAEALEVAKIYSVAGLLRVGLETARPFRAPHHTASSVALVGGGRWPRPGEISLAHRGVLFLDEFPEFPRFITESLRQPLEDGVITVARSRGTLSFPARFILIASQNPCPCGYASDPDQSCGCTAAQIVRYRGRISGPILDRIDLNIEVPRVKLEKIHSAEPAESSAEIRKRVAAARAIQQSRLQMFGLYANSEMRAEHLREFCRLSEAPADLLRAAAGQFHLSARSYGRILKVSRTIADLAHSETILAEHAAEALQFRAKSD